MTGIRARPPKAHPFTAAERGPHCRRCGGARSRRHHQPLYWRIIHPGARYR